MSDYRLRLVTLLLGLLGAVSSAAAQPVAGPVASDAQGIGATFQAAGVGDATLWPVADVGGASPPAYAKIVTVPTSDQSIPVPSADVSAPMVASFTARATALVSETTSQGVRADQASAHARSRVGSARLTLSTAASAAGRPTQLWLDIEAENVSAAAGFSRTLPAPSAVTGKVTIGSLRIAGSLLGGRVVTAAGAQAANTVLYQSPTITVIADRQIPADVIPCPNCAVRPGGITVRAVDIALHGALIGGRPVSGDIVLASAATW